MGTGMLSSRRTGNCAKPASTAEAGFTLIELLAAVAIGSLLLVGLYTTFLTVFRASYVAGESLEKHIEAGRLLDRAVSEIHSAYFDVNNKLTSFKGGIDGMNSTLELTFYREPVVRKDTPFTDLSAIRYSVEGASEMNLVKEHWNPYTGRAVKTVLVEGIEGFYVQYLNGSSWVKAWDGGLERRLPAAVKITIKFDGGSELTALARTMIE